MRKAVLCLVTWAFAFSFVFAQAATPAPGETVVFENDQIRVLLVRLGPHEKTAGAQTAPALEIALTDLTERVTLPNGKSDEVKLLVGQVGGSDGAASVENLSGSPSDKLVVQFKTKQAAQNLAESFKQLTGQSRMAANEASATSCMRTLNTAQVVFARTYKQGFSEGLNRLGPPAENAQPNISRADLLTPWLAGLSEGGTDRAITRNGYRITYTPGPGTFGNIASYTIEAVPLEYGVTGKRSFYTDESAVIRSTAENRPATKSDPPL